MNWPVNKLNAVCEISMGQAPDGSTYNDRADGLPLVAGAGDFGDFFPSAKKFTSAPGKRSAVGDIILCIRATIGDTNWSDKEYCLGRGVAGLRARDGLLDSRFLWHFIGARRSELEARGTGSTFKQVSRADIAEWLIPTPPVAEQKRIATVLDKADCLRHKRHEAIRLADAFIRAVFIDMFGVPGESSKWPESFVANMLSSIESGWSAPSSDRDINDQDLAVLKVSAVSTGWFLPEEAKPVDREIVDRPLVFPRRGDLLFSRANTRELVAACCLVDEDVDNRFLPDKLWRVTADPKQATNEYLCYLFRHPAFRHQLTKQATGTSGSMLNISQAKLLSTPAPLPPLALQQKFTKIVNRSQAARRNSKNSLRDLQSLKESLTARLFG